MISLPLLINEESKRLANKKSDLEGCVIKCYNIPSNINETIFEYLCELLNDKSYKINKIIKPTNQETCSSYPWKIICNDKLASFLLKKKKIFIYDDSEKNNKIYVKIPHGDGGENCENGEDKPFGGGEENVKGAMKRCENSDIWYCTYNSKCEESDNSEYFSDWSSDIKSDEFSENSSNHSKDSDKESENSQLKKNNKKKLNKDRNRIKYSHGNDSDNESVQNCMYNQNDEKNTENFENVENVENIENIEKYIEECLKKGEKKKNKIYKWKNMSKEIKDIPIETLTSEECKFLEKINMKYSKKFNRIIDEDDKKKSKKFFIYFYEGNSNEIIQDIREEDINKNIIL
ncbi:hypothetical protein [Plasmodium yoelii yoelii]|uniref:Uncharacterized protein n=3 Tax=Plasmodium yoelii TaxID=5861 RepID=A0AAE9WLH1_PLAYO|nr:hypothetical protein [Plasmodium yoelii yoelii]WBY56253.1 hypothetical protein Py17XNL_000704131 [Plasmodium yoelii yoelii]